MSCPNIYQGLEIVIGHLYLYMWTFLVSGGLDMIQAAVSASDLHSALGALPLQRFLTKTVPSFCHVDQTSFAGIYNLFYNIRVFHTANIEFCCWFLLEIIGRRFISEQCFRSDMIEVRCLYS